MKSTEGKDVTYYYIKSRKAGLPFISENFFFWKNRRGGGVSTYKVVGDEKSVDAASWSLLKYTW